VRGEVLSYDSTAGTGLISGDDGARYGFSSAALQSPATPAPGVRVDFVPEGDQATQILILAGGPSTVGVAGGLSASTDSTITAFDWKTLFFSFQGRTRRSHFWIAFLVLFGVNTVVGMIPVVNVLLGWLVALVSIWPNLAISVTRLHDMGRPGWLIAIPWAAMIILSFVGFAMVAGGAVASGMTAEYVETNPAAVFAMMAPGFGAFALACLVPLAFLLWIGLTDSQPGENRFGPNPKGL
jgi:uncharacterized membrane protein YhaH (DUF805 family)